MATEQRDAFQDAGIFRGKDVQDKFGISPKKLLGWLNGYRVCGHNRTELAQPLRHFKDGTCIITTAEWLKEFLIANASMIGGDHEPT